jgi:hypothetical protein
MPAGSNKADMQHIESRSSTRSSGAPERAGQRPAATVRPPRPRPASRPKRHRAAEPPSVHHSKPPRARCFTPRPEVRPRFPHEMRNVTGGQGGDGSLGSLHHAEGSGVLAQNISRLVCHTRESRIPHSPIQSVSARRTAVRHPVTPALATMMSILITSDLLLMNVWLTLREIGSRRGPATMCKHQHDNMLYARGSRNPHRAVFGSSFA